MKSKIIWLIFSGIIVIEVESYNNVDSRQKRYTNRGIQGLLDSLYSKGKGFTQHDGPPSRYEDTAVISGYNNIYKPQPIRPRKPNMYSPRGDASVLTNIRPTNYGTYTDPSKYGDKYKHDSTVRCFKGKCYLFDKTESGQYSLRCSCSDDDRCGCGSKYNKYYRNGSDDDDDDDRNDESSSSESDSSEEDNYNRVLDLRCAGGRCGKRPNNVRAAYADNWNSAKSNLGPSVKCSKNGCVVQLDDEDDRNYDNLYTTRHKLLLDKTYGNYPNDDINIVVVDTSYANNQLAGNTNKLQNLLASLGNTPEYSNNRATDNVEAIIVDLTDMDDGETIANQIKNLISYGNNKLNKPSKYSAENRSPKILAHDERNDNVYFPKWLLDRVVSNDEKQKVTNDVPNFVYSSVKNKNGYANSKSRVMAPNRIWGTGAEDLGLPVHVEVQGLGQYNR